MKIEIGNYIHEVIYIEYQNRIPWRVVTKYFVTTAKVPYWRTSDWDVFKESGDKQDLRIYNSGDGGSPTTIEAPKYIESAKNCYYWIYDDNSLVGIPENISKVDKPIRVKGYYGRTSINPFKISELTHSQEYCEVCEFTSVDFCHEHMYDDKDGNVRYKHDNSFAE